MTHSYRGTGRALERPPMMDVFVRMCVHVFKDGFVCRCESWLIVCVRHDSFVCALIRMCVMTHVYTGRGNAVMTPHMNDIFVRYDSLYGETWLIVWWDMTHSYVHLFVCVSWWLRLVGSIQLYVSFAKEPYKRDAILQKHLFVCVSWCHS